MFAALQFPFADARGFIPDGADRLPVPTWPTPEPDLEFVRSFGPVRRRPRGGVENWPGEEMYCEAGHAIRFDETEAPLARTRIVQPSGARVRAWCAYRRLYVDGRATARLETGLGFQRRDRLGVTLSSADLLDLVTSTLAIPMRVRSLPRAIPLIEVGRPIAAHYREATTRRTAPTATDRASWWLAAGMPLMLLEYEHHEDFAHWPKGVSHIRTPPQHGIRLSYLRVRLTLGHAAPTGRELGVWLVGIDPRTNRDFLRRLRLQLMRLHAEQQTIKQIFRMISKGELKIDETQPTFQALQAFLRDSMSLLLRKSRFGLKQSEILTAAQQYDEAVDPGERASLLAALDRVRPNLMRSIESYTEWMEEGTAAAFTRRAQTIIINTEGPVDARNQSINISGTGNTVGDINQVAADTIQNSFNKVAGSAASDELRARLEELHRAVQEILPQLPADSQQQVARDVETLSQEATSDSPRRKWYELSADGIIEAANTLGKIASPVVVAVKAIMALLV